MSTAPLQYVDADSSQSLREGIAEYYAHNSALLEPSALSAELADLFRQHDAGHVIFGCDTSLRGETLIDTWTIFATTAGVRGYLEYFKHPQVNQLFAEAGYWQIVCEFLRCVPDVLRVLLRSRQVSARWPWPDYERYLDRSLCDIRREYAIRVV